MNTVAIRLMGAMAAPTGRAYSWQVAGFLATGAIAGAVLSLSVFGAAPVAAAQGAFGGIVAALWIAFMVPKRLVPEPAPF